MTNPTMLDHALAHARAGIRVFPLLPNSGIPAVKEWPRKATTDEATIRNHWTRNPNDNIGGIGNVVDIDVKNGKRGKETFARLDILNGFPETWTAVTASGGVHLWYDDTVPLKNTVEKIGPGLDTRGHNGFGVLPGSIIKGKTYRWLDGFAPTQHPRTAAPKWLADALGEYREAEAKEHVVAPGVTLDSPDAIERARDWLRTKAPEAVEGAGGDATTYWTVCRVKDFGVSAETCLELLTAPGGWNEMNAAPPWTYDDLAAKVRNAYAYGQESIGTSSPEADFAPIKDAADAANTGFTDDPDTIDWSTAPSDTPKRSPFNLHALDFDEDISAIPKRQWLIKSLAIRGYVTVIVAPPGVGKTTYTGQVALAAVTGNGKIGGIELAQDAIHGLNVWLHNNEDDTDELRRRLAAARVHHGVTKQDQKGRLYATSGSERQLTIARRTTSGKITPADVDGIIAEIKTNGIDLFIADPFLETHEANENDNREINEVGRMYRRIAQETGCAVILVHHTNKPQGASSEGRAGDMNSARGASALMGVARIAKTLYEMSDKDAAKVGVAEAERHLYVRLDDAKANLALRSGKAAWMKRVTVSLMNGDDVGVLDCVELEAREVVEGHQVVDLVGGIVLEEGGSASLNRVADRLYEKSMAASAANEEVALFMQSRNGGIRKTGGRLKEDLRAMLLTGPFYIVLEGEDYEVNFLQEKGGVYDKNTVLVVPYKT